MKDKFQIGDLVRLSAPISGGQFHNRLGLVVSKMLGPCVEGEEDIMMYNVLFDNTITTWYDPSLKKVEARNENV